MRLKLRCQVAQPTQQAAARRRRETGWASGWDCSGQYSRQGHVHRHRHPRFAARTRRTRKLQRPTCRAGKQGVAAEVQEAVQLLAGLQPVG